MSKSQAAFLAIFTDDTASGLHGRVPDTEMGIDPVTAYTGGEACCLCVGAERKRKYRL